MCHYLVTWSLFHLEMIHVCSTQTVYMDFLIILFSYLLFLSYWSPPGLFFGWLVCHNLLKEQISHTSNAPIGTHVAFFLTYYNGRESKDISYCSVDGVDSRFSPMTVLTDFLWQMIVLGKVIDNTYDFYVYIHFIYVYYLFTFTYQI